MSIKPFALERYFAEHEFSAPYLLSSSDCEALSIGDLLAYEPAAAERFHAQWLGYTESQGDPHLRTAISTLYQATTADQILVHSGAEEAIYAFVRATLRAGDRIIVQTPCYQSLYEVAASVGCEVVAWEAQEAQGWDLDLDVLQRSLNANTRAVILNLPHNPTGYLMSRPKFDRLIEIVAQQGVPLFVDEVYRLLEQDPALTLPAVADVYEHGVSLGVMSKTFGLAGLRIGWVATHDRRIFQQMAAYKDYLTICNSAPSEFLATLALRHWRAIRDRNLAITRENLALLDAFFAGVPNRITWVPPQASSTGFARLHDPRGATAFTKALVEQQGVMLLPSTTYHFGDQHFRVGFGRKNMPDALARLEVFLQTY